MNTLISKATAALLPRGVREESLELLGKRDLPPMRLAKAAAQTLAWAYRVQAKASFDKRLWAAEMVSVVLCLAAAPPGPWILALAAVMLGITCRDAYTHTEKAPRMAKYYLDSLGDAVAAMLFLIVSQAVATQVSPSMALGKQLLLRSLLVLLPILAAVRMVLRPRPAADFKPEFNGTGWSAEKVYIKTWTLTVLWVVMFAAVVSLNVTDRHFYWPDMLRGWLPYATFMMWVSVQRVALRGRSGIETLKSLVTKLELYQIADRLPGGLKRGEPLYWAYVVFEALIFVEMSLSLLAAVEPFLFGKPLEESVFRAVGAVFGFAMSVVSWRYIKEANREAGRIIRELVEA